MTDSTDKKSIKTSDQDNQHESLDHSLNSIDKKTNVDLDAMLDEAESSSVLNEFQDDEDALDRLLINTGFNLDDELMQVEAASEVDVAKDVDQHDELDDFLSFDGFGDDFNKPESVVEAEQAVTPLNEIQNDEDDLDRLLMNTALDADYTPQQARENIDTLEDADSFSGVSDFNESEIGSAVKSDTPESQDLLTDDTDQPDEDELNGFLSSIDDFDESDMIQDDEVPAEAALIDPLAGEESDEKINADIAEELDSFSDFSDFDESDIIPEVEEDAELDHSTENLSSTDDTDMSDDIDDLLGFDADFSEPGLAQDDNDQAFIPALVDLSISAKDETLAKEEDIDAVEGLDDFSGFNDFNEPEIIPSAEIEKPERVVDNSSSSVNDDNPTGEFDEFSGFDGFGEDFDESDMIRDDEVESNREQEAVIEQSLLDDKNTDDLFLNDGLSKLEQTTEITDDADISEEVSEFGESDLIQDDEIEDSLAVSEELPTVAERKPQVDENSFNDLFAHADSDTDGASDILIDDTSLLDEVDSFSGFSDDFNESDLIMEDGLETSADAIAANEELPAVVEEPFNGLQDDDDSFNNLFADADFGEEHTLEQTQEKNDAFGDDASLDEINSFFQLSEEDGGFSVQREDSQLTEDEKPTIQDEQEEDFLLPDFDITADTEISDTLADAEFKETEFSDAFGDAGLLNGNEVAPVSALETSEIENEAVAEPEPAAVENIENVKLNPFDFEYDDFKKQLEDAENKVKKTKRYAYVAMGFGAVALSAAAGLGVMTYGAKTEVSRLNEAVTTLEANLAKSSANSSTGLLNNNMPDIVAKQDMVSKALDVLQVKVGDLEEKASLAPSVIEPPKVEAATTSGSVKAEKAHDTAPAKTAPEHDQVKSLSKHDSKDAAEPEHDHAKEVTTQEPPSIKKEAAHEQTSAKEKSKHEAAPGKVKPQPEVVAEVPAVKPTSPEKTVVQEKPVEEKPVKVSKPAAIGKWGINLVAFKQEWFAKSKAAEFARLGVFADVIPVHEKNTTMYRLRVGGFKSKAEASANTAKIKQALNLDSVWVSDN
jgi:cell division protein FtsN